MTRGARKDPKRLRNAKSLEDKVHHWGLDGDFMSRFIGANYRMLPYISYIWSLCKGRYPPNLALYWTVLTCTYSTFILGPMNSYWWRGLRSHRKIPGHPKSPGSFWEYMGIYGGFLSHGGTPSHPPSSSIFDWEFPYKPSSDKGVPWF